MQFIPHFRRCYNERTISMNPVASTLDPVASFFIPPYMSSFNVSVSVYDPVISDHMWFTAIYIHVNKPSCPKKKIAYRNLRSINIDDFLYWWNIDVRILLIQIYFCYLVCR